MKRKGMMDRKLFKTVEEKLILFSTELLISGEITDRANKVRLEIIDRDKKLQAENERLNKCIENDMLVNIEEYMLCPDSKLSPMAIEHKRDIITAVKKLLKEHNETETE